MDDVDYLGASGSVLSYNFYSYCENNPVNNEDSTGNYSKKMLIKESWLFNLASLIGINISDDKLSLIHANIDIVLDNICAFDIHLYDLINYSSLDSKIKEFLINSVVDVNDNIFKTKYVPLYLDKSIRTDIITNIRLKMQEMLMQENNILNSI